MLLNSEGERFMEKYAPNKMELASRDVVSRAEQTEILEGRGVGAERSGIWLDITKVPRKRTLGGAARDREHRQRLRRRRHHARADHDPPRPALHHGRRQDRRRRRDLDRGPVRRRRGRLRVGARRQPPRRELAARHADLRAPRGRTRRRAGRDDGDAEGDTADAQLREDVATIDSIIARARARAGASRRSSRSSATR